MSQSRPRITVKNLGTKKVTVPYVAAYPTAQGSYNTTGLNAGGVVTDFGNGAGDFGTRAPLEVQQGIVLSNSGEWFAQYSNRAWQDASHAANPPRKRLHSTSSIEGARSRRRRPGQDPSAALPVIIPHNVEILRFPLPSGEPSPCSTPDPESELPLPMPYNIENPPPPEVYGSLSPTAATEYRFKYSAADDQTHAALKHPPGRADGKVIRKELKTRIPDLKKREAKNEEIISDMEQAEWSSRVYPPRDPRWW